jgi:hypothetical protein
VHRQHIIIPTVQWVGGAEPTFPRVCQTFSLFFFRFLALVPACWRSSGPSVASGIHASRLVILHPRTPHPSDTHTHTAIHILHACRLVVIHPRTPHPSYTHMYAAIHILLGTTSRWLPSLLCRSKVWADVLRQISAMPSTIYTMAPADQIRPLMSAFPLAMKGVKESVYSGKAVFSYFLRWVCVPNHCIFTVFSTAAGSTNSSVRFLQSRPLTFDCIADHSICLRWCYRDDGDLASLHSKDKPHYNSKTGEPDPPVSIDPSTGCEN